MTTKTLDWLGKEYGVDKASNGRDYLRHYQEYLYHLKDEKFLLIEIGGLNGASLKLWYNYFKQARIVCIDVDPGVKKFENKRTAVEIGDSSSIPFLNHIREKYKSPAVIIDDGSHRWDHQRVAFEQLFPMLEAGGIYIIEDLYTSYDPNFSGNDEESFFDYMKGKLDFLHMSGERRREYEKSRSRESVELAKSIDQIVFVPRSCIVRKKGERIFTPKFAGAGSRPDVAPDPSALKALTPEEFALRPEVKVVHPARAVDVVVPRCSGALERPEGVKSVDVPAQTLTELRDVICGPRQVLLQGGALLPDSFRRNSSRHKHVQLDALGGGWLRPKKPLEPVRTVEEPCFFLDGEHADHFGHFTLEVLSRLWPFREVDFSKFRFILSARPTERHLELLSPFGITAEQLLYFHEPILCRNLLTPSQGYVLERYVSPAALDVWDHIGARYETAGGPEKLYVSRTKWPKQRNLREEAEIEAHARDLGFAIVHPELLTVPEQIAVFRNARVIAGPSGSGLYNAIYARRKGARLILASSRFVTMNDAIVNQQSRSDMAYVTGTADAGDAPGMLADWSIDVALAKKALEAL